MGVAKRTVRAWGNHRHSTAGGSVAAQPLEEPVRTVQWRLGVPRMRSVAAIANADSKNATWMAVCHINVFSS